MERKDHFQARGLCTWWGHRRNKFGSRCDVLFRCLKAAMAETQDGLREQYWLGLDVMLEDLPRNV